MNANLKADIRNALAGSSSQKPVDVVKLYALGSKAEVDAALAAMHAATELNTALSTKQGVTTSLYWLTGAVNLRTGPQGIVINRPAFEAARTIRLGTKNPQLGTAHPDEKSGSSGSENAITSKTAKVQPKTQISKESTMSTNPVTIKHILDIVIASPGVKRDDVMKTLVSSDGSNRKKVAVCISNGIQNKVLKQTEKDGVKYLNPGPKANDSLATAKPTPAKPQEAAKKSPAAKLLTGDEGRTAAKKSAPAKKKSVAPEKAKPAQPVQDGLFLAYLEEGILSITLEDSSVELNVAQAARVHKFIGRLGLNGAA